MSLDFREDWASESHSSSRQKQKSIIHVSVCIHVALCHITSPVKLISEFMCEV